jgi:RimJ/RimL family protein N-acetyltransferase
VNNPTPEPPAIELRLFAPAHLLALIETPERFEALVGSRAAEGLREFFVSGEVSPHYLASLRGRTRSDVWRDGFAVVHRDSNLVIGLGGFKGCPDECGAVEIAYAVVPSFEGRGYATQIARMLVEFALQNDDVRLVRAHTLPTPNASTKVLTKCGFAYVGAFQDPEDGLVWRWELARVRNDDCVVSTT